MSHWFMTTSSTEDNVAVIRQVNSTVHSVHFSFCSKANYGRFRKTKVKRGFIHGRSYEVMVRLEDFSKSLEITWEDTVRKWFGTHRLKLLYGIKAT